MAFKKVETQRTYFKYAECKKGDTLVSEGLYAGPEEGKYGIQHIFKQKDGKVICLNASGHLNWLIDNHGFQGMLCNIKFDGEVILHSGKYAGKPAYNFELEIDEDYVDESPRAAAKAATPAPYVPTPAEIEDISL
jgi:hypothetical protein